MKKIIRFPSYIFIICFSAILFTQQPALAAIELYDGKLVLNGFIKEVGYYRTGMTDRDKNYYDNKLAYLQTSGLLEALYTVRDDDMTIRLFVGVKYWWQKAQYFDDEMDRSIRQPDQRSWANPRDWDEDILTEAYTSIEKGPFEVRIGKQIVVWGSLDLAQVTDVVNAPDFRRGYPGINTWEEIKQGAWMIRAFYQSELPGNLLFEVIFNPGDYHQINLAHEATWPGTAPYNVRRAGAGFSDDLGGQRGIYSWLREKWTRDEPGFNTSNWEAGFRIRGFTYGIDWTFIYWNALQDDFIMTADFFPDFYNFYFDWNDSSNGTEPYPYPDQSQYPKLFDSKRYEMIGGTFERYSPEIWDTVWIIEWALDFGHPIQKGAGGNPDAPNGYARRNIFDIGIKVQKALNIPWFTQSFIATGRMLDIAITYQWDKVLGYKSATDVVNSRWHQAGDSVADNITLWFKQDMFHNKLVLVFVGNYYFQIGKWQAIPSLGYSLPGKHWRIEGGYAMYGGKSKTTYEHIDYSSHNDSVFFRIRYEF